MDALPLEIIDEIVSFADYNTRRQLLTVSWSFQVSVERHTWCSYRWTTSSNVNEFLDKYCGHRCRYLRNIDIHVEFPFLVDTPERPLKCRETAVEIHAHNERFTRQIVDLFNAVKVLEDRELPRNRPSGIRLCIQNPYQLDDNQQFCYHRRFHSWRLQLLNPENLPTLSSVQTLAIVKQRITVSTQATHQHIRPLDFGIIPALISRLPSLDVLDCPFLCEGFPEAHKFAIVSHFTRLWEGPWRDTRHVFGKTLLDAATLPKKIQSAKLLFGDIGFYSTLEDQSRALPDLVRPLPYDPLSSGLRVLSQRVVNLEIRACVDSTVFWPAVEDPTSESPSWPFLEHFSFSFRPVLPSGTWYLEGPRGEGRDANRFEITQAHYPPVEDNAEDETCDEIWDWEGGRFEEFSPNMFRIMPCDEVIGPFLEAFAKALANMPALESVFLFTLLAFNPGTHDIRRHYPERHDDGTAYPWGLRYHFPKDGGSPRLEWRVGDWRPSEKLLQRFHDLANSRGGNPLEETWMDWRCLDWDDPWRDIART